MTDAGGSFFGAGERNAAFAAIVQLEHRHVHREKSVGAPRDRVDHLIWTAAMVRATIRVKYDACGCEKNPQRSRGRGA
jgi:hypothetical protein